MIQPEETQKKSNNTLLWLTAIAILMLFMSLQQCQHNKELAEKDNLYTALNDSLKTWTDKDGKSHSEKQIAQTDKPKEFINAKSNDKEVIALQKLVKKYQNELGKSGSVSRITGENVVDTSYTKPVIVYKDRFFYKDSISNKWIDWKYQVVRDTVNNKDNVDFKLKLNYEYAVIYKEKSNGLFRKPTPYAEVVNYSPYSKTLSLTTYRVVKDVKTKRFGIGPSVIYGVGPEFTSGVFVGIGANYNIIRF